MVEELVAYLDGELDMDSNRRVERRLAHDATFRRQLRELQQSWDLLDHLPRADVDESFTESTIAMVALRTSDDRRQYRDHGRRHSRFVLVSAAACAVVGFRGRFLGDPMVGRPPGPAVAAGSAGDRERIDEYRYAESIEFLRLLEREGLFVEGGIEHEL
jgi:anti-sigma factor RsiW